MFSFSVFSAFLKYGFKRLELPAQIPQTKNPSNKANSMKSSSNNNDNCDSDGTIENDDGLRKEDDTSSEYSSVSTRSQTKLLVQAQIKTPKKRTKDWFTCKTCKENYPNCDKIQEHCFVMHSDKVHVCSIEKCFKYFKSSTGLRNHCRDNHSDVLKCDMCSKICTSYSNLNSHKDAAHISAKFKCKHCHQGCSRDSDMKRHWNYTCPENPNRYMRCKQCIKKGVVDPDVEGAEPGLINHLTSKHAMTGAYLCIYCHTLFQKQETIDKHQKRCSKTRPKPDLALTS